MSVDGPAGWQTQNNRIEEESPPDRQDQLSAIGRNADKCDWILRSISVDKESDSVQVRLLAILT